MERARSPGNLCGAQPARPKEPRVGGRDRGRPQEAPPTCPPCALRHQAGTGTLGRSRLEGLALGKAVQGPGPPTLRLGDGCLGGALTGQWELGVPVRRPHLAVNSPSCARRPPLPGLPATQPSVGRRREGGRKQSFPSLSAHALRQLSTLWCPGGPPDRHFEP